MAWNKLPKREEKSERERGRFTQGVKMETPDKQELIRARDPVASGKGSGGRPSGGEDLRNRKRILEGRRYPPGGWENVCSVETLGDRPCKIATNNKGKGKEVRREKREGDITQVFLEGAPPKPERKRGVKRGRTQGRV